MSDSVIIRHCAEADVEQISEIDADCFTSEAWQSEDFIYRIREQSRFICLTAFDSRLNEVAGFLFAASVAGEVYIDSIAVKKSFRRKGIAGRLLRFLEDLTPSAEFYSLEVRSKNSPAAALYSSVGYSVSGVRKGYYSSPPDDAVIMTKIKRR